MIYRHFKIDVALVGVKNYKVFNDEKISLNIMTNNDDNVQTYAFNTGVAGLGDRCTANMDPVVTSAQCELMVSSCFRETDKIIVNIMKAGNPLKETLTCKDIFDAVVATKSGDCKLASWGQVQQVLTGKGSANTGVGGCTYKSMVDAIKADIPPPADHRATGADFCEGYNCEGTGWVPKIIKKGDESNAPEIHLRYRAGQMWRSLEPDCYVGQNDAFRAPHCSLFKPDGSRYDDPNLTVDAYKINNHAYFLETMMIEDMMGKREKRDVEFMKDEHVVLKDRKPRTWNP